MKEFKNLYLSSIKHIKEVETKLIELTKQLDQQRINNELRLLDNASIKQIFNISDKTLSNWRKKGLLIYSKISGSIYYDISDVKKLVEDSKIGIKKKD
jgi:hypothetical protein